MYIKINKKNIKEPNGERQQGYKQTPMSKKKYLLEKKYLTALTMEKMQVTPMMIFFPIE